MNKTPFMPKATAVWLVENTTLTFKQIAEFCNLHELEIKGIADGDVAKGIKACNPILAGQLSREEIELSSKDENRPLKIKSSDIEISNNIISRKNDCLDILCNIFIFFGDLYSEICFKRIQHSIHIFLVPLSFLVFRIVKTFIEIYKGSLIDISENLFTTFTLKFKLWITAFIAVLFFNPSTITRFWAYDSVNVGDLMDGTKLMYFYSLQR